MKKDVRLNKKGGIEMVIEMCLKCGETGNGINSMRLGYNVCNKCRKEIDESQSDSIKDWIENERKKFKYRNLNSEQIQKEG